MRLIMFLGFMTFLAIPAFPQLVTENDSTYISIFNSPIELSEVIIDSRKRSMQSKGLGNIQINTQILKTSPLFLGERDVIKIIQFLPGFSAGMEGSSQLNIRGGTNDQTLYLLDNIPVYNQNHTFGLFSVFNSDAVKNVEVYKGGIPSQYGDKLSGVISLDLKEGDYEKHTTSISLGMLAATFASEGYVIKDKISYNFAARRSFIDLLYKGFMGLAGEGNDGTAMISFYDINTKLSWKMNAKNNLSWQMYSGYDDIYGSNTTKNKYSNEKFSEKYGYGWKNFMSGIRYYSQLSTNLLLSSNIYYTSLDNFDYYKSVSKLSEGKHKLENGNSSLLKEYGGKIALEHKIDRINTLFYGFETAYQKYTPDYVFKKNNNQVIEYQSDYLQLIKYSGYVSNELNYNQWGLTTGLRFSLYDNMKNKIFAIEPRLKINWFLSKKDKLMFAYDYMCQSVNTINETKYNVQTDFWLPYQEGKLPNSSQISVGWKQYTSSNLTISIEAYYKKMNNLLKIKDVENYMDFHSDFDIGGGTALGSELMIEYTKGDFTSWVSYTLSRSLRSFGSESFPFKYDAPHNLSVFGNYNLNKSDIKKHSISVNLKYQTGYPYYIPNISYPTFGLPTSSSGYEEIRNIFSVDYIPDLPNTRLRNYFRMDLNYTLEKKTKWGYSSWQFSLLNITNRSNPYAIYKDENKYKAFVLIPIFPSISYKMSF